MALAVLSALFGKTWRKKEERTGQTLQFKAFASGINLNCTDSSGNTQEEHEVCQGA